MGKYTEYPTIKDIDTPEKMKLFVDATNDELKAARAERNRFEKSLIGMQDIFKSGDIISQDNKAGAWPKEKTESFGKMFRDLAERKIQKIGEIELVGKTEGTPITSDAVTGQYATGQEYVNDILREAQDISNLRPFVRKIKMSDRITNYPIEDSQPTFVYVSTDSSAMSEHAQTFLTPVVLTAYNYAFWVSVTESLLEDSLFNLAEYIRTTTIGALARIIDTELLVGVTPFTGLMTNASTNIVRASDTTFGSIDGDALFDMVSALDTEQKRSGAMWIGHPTIFDYLWRLQDGTGRYTFRDVMIAGAAGRLIGYPWITSGQMPSSSDSAKDTAFLALGNPRNTMILGDRLSLEFKKFDQMASTMEEGEVVFRARCRMAFNIHFADHWSVLKTQEN